MNDMEIVIVGGGPAGLSTALSIARHAPSLRKKIIVLERATYPREKICAGAVSGRAWNTLVSLGARPRVPAVPVGGFELEGCQRTQRARIARAGFVIRRAEFDTDLAQRVIEAGVQVQDGTRVEDIAETDGGVELRTSHGTLRSRFVVGAGGVGCLVRRRLGLGNGRLRAQVVEVDTDPSAFDSPDDALRFDGGRDNLTGYVWDFPTIVDGRLRVCRGVYQLRDTHRQDELREPDVTELLRRHLADRGVVADGGRFKRFGERGYEAGSSMGSRRCMLVGESAGIDPITGEGIGPSIDVGLLAGRFLGAALSEQRDSVEAWDRRFRRSSVGLDLTARSLVALHLLLRRRRLLDRVLTSQRFALLAGAHYFAGRPLL